MSFSLPRPAAAYDAADQAQTRRRIEQEIERLGRPSPTFLVADLPPATAAGRWIFVPDAAGGAVMAFSDGTTWRRCTDRAVVA